MKYDAGNLTNIYYIKYIIITSITWLITLTITIIQLSYLNIKMGDTIKIYFGVVNYMPLQHD